MKKATQVLRFGKSVPWRRVVEFSESHSPTPLRHREEEKRAPPARELLAAPPLQSKKFVQLFAAK